MGSHKEYCKAYEQRFKDYSFKINPHHSEPFDPENAAINVRLSTKNGDEYSSIFITLNYLSYLFEKNARTGECASGSYFAMLEMVIVKRIDELTVKATIDGLIDELAVELHFQKLEKE